MGVGGMGEALLIICVLLCWPQFPYWVVMGAKERHEGCMSGIPTSSRHLIPFEITAARPQPGNIGNIWLRDYSRKPCRPEGIAKDCQRLSKDRQMTGKRLSNDRQKTVNKLSKECQKTEQRPSKDHPKTVKDRQQIVQGRQRTVKRK